MTLEDELSAIYGQTRDLRIGAGQVPFAEALTSKESSVQITAQIRLREMSKAIPELLQKDSRLPGSKVLMMRRPGGMSGFYPVFAADLIVRRTIENGKPTASIEWIQKLLSTSSAEGFSITALWGVPVTEQIQLTSDVTLVPIAALPESPQKRWITESGLDLSDGLIATILHFDNPTSALVIKKHIEPLFVEPDKSGEEDDFIKTYELLSDIALALTAVGPRVSLQAAHWFNFEDPNLDDVGFGNAKSRPLIEILPTKFTDFPPLDAIVAIEVVQQFLKTNGPTRNKLRVALERLNQAQRRRNPGDQAVELATAFETLVGDNATTEMTHKVKIRTTRLLGGVEDTRRRNAVLIGKTYDVRSSLVHTGHVDAAATETICGERKPVTHILEEATKLCAELIRIILQRGSIPEWPKFDVS